MNEELKHDTVEVLKNSAAPEEDKITPAADTADETVADSTPEPEATAPEATVPEASAQDTVAPEVPQPDTPVPDASVPDTQSTDAQSQSPTEETAPATGRAYCWTYEEMLEAKQTAATRGARRGGIIYAAVMTACFLVCFALLITVLATGYGSGGETVYLDRTIFVRQDMEGSGLLTIPEIAAKVKPSVVGIYVTFKGGTGVGSGIIMSTDGYIATNYHVVEQALSVTVITDGGAEYDAEIVGGDPTSDLALIKITADGLTAAEFGDSDALLVGEDVVAIGTPAGLEYAGTVTDGIISAISRDVRIYDDTGLLIKTMTLIQTNTNINPGNSGGPLIDAYGHVIGINSMKLADDYDGIGFAIPINGALRILEEIKQTGSYSGSGDVAQLGARLGITGMDVKEGVEYRINADLTITAAQTGVMVTSLPDATYDISGKVELYDIIVAIDGDTVTGINGVRAIIASHRVGDTVSIKCYRGSESFTVSVKLGS